MAKTTPKRTLANVLPWILIIGGLIGLAAASILTIEKIELIKNPAYVPTCNLNPILSCGSVMETWQASAFGFPNALLGLIGFSVVSTVGMALLAGATFKRWFWLGLQLGATLGMIMIHWLIFQSIFNIQALCPYCMVVWSVTITIFWYTTLYNLRTGVIATPARLKGLVAFLQRHHGDVLLVWFLAIIAVILQHFWYYWKTLI